MKIEGQTEKPVMLDIFTPEGTARINLGCCLVVNNLGVEVHLGQPAKYNHQIVTMPHSGQVVFKDISGNQHSCSTVDDSPLEDANIPKAIMRLEEDTHVYPREKLSFKLPGS